MRSAASGERPAPIGPAVVGAAPADAASRALSRELGLFDITMLVMGTIIGVGIFAVPHSVAALVPDSTLVLAAWVVGGVVTLAGSLVYAELTRRRPHVGGQYAYLREAYHPGVAFVYGWSLLWIMQSGGMASVAVVFARYFLKLGHLFAEWRGWDAGAIAAAADSTDVTVFSAVVTTSAIGALTVINCLGVRASSTTQNVFMVLKILAILALVGCGLVLAGRWAPAAADAPATSAPGGWEGLTAFAAALVPVLFSYGGSHTATFVGGEVREPRRTLPRGLVLGVLGVIVLYLSVNYVCLRVLGVRALAAEKGPAAESPAAEVMRLALGKPGAALISVGIAISALGFLSQAMLTSPRVYYAMARDGLFFRAVGWVHPRTRVPVVAVALQGLVAAVIAVSGTFEEILQSVMTVELVFLALTALGLFVIRRHDARTGAAGFALPGHPFTTLLFAGVDLALVANVLYQAVARARVADVTLPGVSPSFHVPLPRLLDVLSIGIALAGVPVYFLWRWLGRPPRHLVS